MPYPMCRQHRGNSRPSNSLRTGMLLSIVTLAILLVGCGPADATPTSTGARAVGQRTFTYVALGASDAFGIGTDDPDRDNWPTVLADLLGPGVHLVNLGIPGETVAAARQTELPIALDAKPALITIWLGVNDIVQSVPLAEYQRQLEAMLITLRQRTQARVFVANIPDLSLLPYFAGDNQSSLRATVATWNAAIAKAVAATGVSLVDLYDTWNELASHPEYIAGDGFHPSTVGAKRLAELFQVRIAPSLPALRAAAGLP
jgi:lysophospholipase L1-like esterase